MRNLLLLSLVTVGIMSFNTARADDSYCREYTKTIKVGGRIQEAFGTACRQEDGAWEIVSEDGRRDTREPVREVIRYESPAPNYYYPSSFFRINYNIVPRYGSRYYYNDRRDYRRNHGHYTSHYNGRGNKYGHYRHHNDHGRSYDRRGYYRDNNVRYHDDGLTLNFNW